LTYLRAAVSALPEKMRHVITQIYFEDRTVKEIAEELGTTHSAVSQQRSEAVRLLKDGLEVHYSDSSSENYVPESRIAPANRNAYLARVAEQALVGMARMATENPRRTLEVAS
jgi:RNA polymerase sigma factor FliA